MVKIPKRIGAVKLSRKVRKKAKKAVEAAANPFVRDFATAAMAAAGRARRASRGGGDGPPNEGKEYRMCTETRINVDGSKVAEAFRTAALDGFRRFLEGFEEGLRKAQAEKAAEKDDPQPEPRAAPRPRASAKPKAAARPKAAAKPKAKPRKPRATRPASGPGPA